MTVVNNMSIGKLYFIDREFNNGGVVELIGKGKLFCNVKCIITGAEWGTMTRRLSEATDVEKFDDIKECLNQRGMDIVRHDDGRVTLIDTDTDSGNDCDHHDDDICNCVKVLHKFDSSIDPNDLYQYPKT